LSKKLNELKAFINFNEMRIWSFTHKQFFGVQIIKLLILYVF